MRIDFCEVSFFRHQVAMRDTTEYQFVSGDRWLTVRRGERSPTATDLRAVADEYGNQLKEFLGATELIVSEVKPLARGGESVRVTATLDDGVVRAALVRFADGPLAEVVMTCEPMDERAVEEFERLLASVRPSQPEETENVARALAAPTRGAPGYPAGPVTLDLLDSYQTTHVFTLEADGGGAQFTLERTDAVAPSARPPAAAGLALATTVSKIGEDGKPVTFEVGPLPRRYSRTSRPAAVAAAGSVVSPVSVSGTVRGTTVRVRVIGDGATADQAKQLIQELDSSH
jgi:hypothetical protein